MLMKITGKVVMKGLWKTMDCQSVTGCSQGGGKQGFVMGSRTQGVQEILEKNIYRMSSPPEVCAGGWDTWSSAIESCLI